MTKWLEVLLVVALTLASATIGVALYMMARLFWAIITLTT